MENFDRTILLERLGGDEELFMEIMEVFFDDVPKQMTVLSVALDGKDAPAIHRQAHTLKGAAGNVGAVMLQNLAHEMEMAGKAGDFEESRTLFAQIEEAFIVVKNCLIQT